MGGDTTPFILIFFENFTIFGFCGRHIENLDDDGNARIVPSLIAQTYLGKVTIEYLSSTCGSEMAAKKSACWVVSPPSPRFSCEG